MITCLLEVKQNLDYFKRYIDNNLHAKYSDIVIEPMNAKGNAMQVYNYAEDFLKKEENGHKLVTK